MATKQRVKATQPAAETEVKSKRTRNVQPSPYRKGLTVTVWLHRDIEDVPPVESFLSRYAERQGLVGKFRELKSGLRVQLDTPASARKPKADKTISRDEIAAAKALLLREDIQDAARAAGESPVEYLARITHRPPEVDRVEIPVTLSEESAAEARAEGEPVF